MSRRLHFVGSCGVLALLAARRRHAAMRGGCWRRCSAATAFAWVGHFFFEKNRPATFRHPFYSFAGDWVMFKDILIGQDPVLEAAHHSRKISHAATTISAKPAQWFHFSGCAEVPDREAGEHHAA